jgi:hypothetical protein
VMPGDVTAAQIGDFALAVHRQWSRFLPTLRISSDVQWPVFICGHRPTGVSKSWTSLCPIHGR